jgi:hypothetical protein
MFDNGLGNAPLVELKPRNGATAPLLRLARTAYPPSAHDPLALGTSRPDQSMPVDQIIEVHVRPSIAIYRIN